MNEMALRGFNVNNAHWYGRCHRGKNLPLATLIDVGTFVYHYADRDKVPIYREHDNAYLKECLLNLKEKGASLVNGASIEKMLVECDLACSSDV